MTEQATKEKVINMVTMQDGTSRNFGERGKLLSSQEVSTKGFSITFHIITGDQVSYEYVSEHEVPELLMEMACFGVSSKVKAATSGCSVDELKTVIQAKVEEIQEGIFTTRGNLGESITPLTQVQTAYALVNGINVEEKEGIAQVNAVFAQLSKEEKSALYKDPKIKLELAKLRLLAAQEALEGAE